MNFWSGKLVIVTGGGGFLGSVIVSKLRDRGAARVIVPRSAQCDLRRDPLDWGYTQLNLSFAYAWRRVGERRANLQLDVRHAIEAARAF